MSARFVCVDVALKHNGVVHMRVFADPRASTNALLKGFSFEVLDFALVDVLEEGGAAELVMLGRTSEDIDANGISIEDAVMLHTRAMVPRLTRMAEAWAPVPSVGPSPVASPITSAAVVPTRCTDEAMGKGVAHEPLRAWLLESQPMGSMKPGTNLGFAAAAAARNTRTKCVQHGIQGALLAQPSTSAIPMRFVSPQIKSADFDSLNRGKPADYAARKKFSVWMARRLLAATLELEGASTGTDTDTGAKHIPETLLDIGDAEALHPFLDSFPDASASADADSPVGSHCNKAFLEALLVHKRKRGVRQTKKDDLCDALLECFYAGRQILAEEFQSAKRNEKAYRKGLKEAAAARKSTIKKAHQQQHQQQQQVQSAMEIPSQNSSAAGIKRKREQEQVCREFAADKNAGAGQDAGRDAEQQKKADVERKALQKRFPLKKALAAEVKSVVEAEKATVALLAAGLKSKGKKSGVPADAGLDDLLDEVDV